MLVENIGAVTLINGVLRIETLKVKPGGDQEKSGELEIPANLVGPILDAMVKSAQEVEKQLKEDLKSNESSNGDANGESSKDSKKKKK